MATLRVKRPGRADRGVVTTPEIDELLAAGAPVAIGVSGGKDSCALAIAVVTYLRAIGYTGPIVLIHADLGRVEWKDSLPTCERLAAALGVELIVVRRSQGDMMDRWLQRWRDNVARYAELECVKIILPWSTPSMRFCTSELKTGVMCRALAARFPGRRIISCAGIRREESPDRAKAPITKEQPDLKKKKLATSGIDWNPILEWTESDVYAYCAAQSFALHEGYTRYGMSRISCAYCIMASGDDLAASASCPDNADVYREMVDLEAISTFAFQGSRWLADVAPHLLSDEQRAAVARAKAIGERREQIEERVPEHLLYTRGWPTVIPTEAEAEELCQVRREIAALLGIEVKYTEPAALVARYTDLFAEARARETAAEKKVARKAARS
jgi:3'-phosphoadenosine 5'-phosphosulfate sulfotransferase (PAPS reductase)/FAD synthetase